MNAFNSIINKREARINTAPVDNSYYYISKSTVGDFERSG